MKSTKISGNYGFIPVAHFAYGELEDGFTTSFESAPQITIRKCPNQVIFIIYDK